MLISLLERFNKLPLWLFILFSFAGYCLLTIWFPLQAYFDQVPLLDIRSFAPSMGSGIGYGILVCLLYFLFILAFNRVKESAGSISLVQILGASIFLALPLLFTYPVNANDIYRYIIRGRIMSQYGDNPFSVPPAVHNEDPFLPYAGEWAGETSPYGPIWELTASGVTAVTGDNLLLGILSFKLLGLVAFAGSSMLIWAIILSSHKGDGSDLVHINQGESSSLTILWAWNPALLLIFIVDGHNDILMVFCLLLGLLIIQKGRSSIGFFIMGIGAFVKPIGILALPIIFVGLLREKRAVGSSLRFTLSVIGGGLLMVLLLFLPFGSPAILMQRLLREAGGGASFSIAALALLSSRASGLNLTNAFISDLSTLLSVTFMLFVIWLMWVTWRGRSAIRSTADIFFGYLVQALNFRIWYAAWPFPWLLLDAAGKTNIRRSHYRLHYGLWFLLTSQLSVLIYGHVRVIYFSGSQFAAHLLGISFTFGLPLLLAWLSNESVRKRLGIEWS